LYRWFCLVAREFVLLSCGFWTFGSYILPAGGYYEYTE